MKTEAEITLGLAQFYGTENYYFSESMKGIAYTDGVKFLIDNAECHWLLLAIWSHQQTMQQNPMCQDIQFWTLTVNADKSAVLIGEEDLDIVIVRQEIPFTDFPLPEIKIWLERGEWMQQGRVAQGMIVMLPSER